jgi:hypothetical protein
VIVGYARTSTVEQVASFEAQERDLRAAGVEQVFAEQISSVASRAQLDAAIDFIRSGDVFVVTKIDRLAGSVADLCKIEDRGQGRGSADTGDQSRHGHAYRQAHAQHDPLAFARFLRIKGHLAISVCPGLIRSSC